MFLLSTFYSSSEWRPAIGATPLPIQGRATGLMINELREIWDRTLQELDRENSKPSAETWLKNARPLALYDETIVVGLPNDFVKDWVESRYATSLGKILSRVLSRPMTLKFVVPPEDQQEKDAGGKRQRSSIRPPAVTTATMPALGLNGARLNHKYTFETFVVGTSNRFAHAAALAVSGAPARAYNPLFIYGGVGLGKTHLMHAIGHRVLELYPAQKVCYVSTETFTNELISSIRDGKMMDFRSKYRNVDVLMLDDVQFLRGKEGTQEELFHTFDALHQASKQIVISSDRPPREIATLEERLRTRFEWGLISDIQAPDTETRMAILRKKARADSIEIPDDVAAFIAQNITSNIRELEGALVRIAAYSSLSGRPVDMPLAREAMREVFPEHRPRQVTIDLIQKVVAEYYSLDPAVFKEKNRSRAVAFPRQIAMYLSREMTDASLPKVGDEFGGRDHTTVIHACQKVIGDVSRDPLLAGTIQQIMTKIRGV